MKGTYAWSFIPNRAFRGNEGRGVSRVQGPALRVPHLPRAGCLTNKNLMKRIRAIDPGGLLPLTPLPPHPPLSQPYLVSPQVCSYIFPFEVHDTIPHYDQSFPSLAPDTHHIRLSCETTTPPHNVPCLVKQPAGRWRLTDAEPSLCTSPMDGG